MSQKFGDWFRNNYRSVIIGALVFVPFIVSIISTIHVVNFFKLSNFSWLAITLAIAFEVGALSALAAIAVMDKINKFSLWSIFILITLMQMMGNTYYAFDFISNRMLTDPTWTQNWIDLFSINNAEIGVTKRILAIISGAILPIISLTFLHMLITYITKTRTVNDEEYEYEYVTVDKDGNEIIEEVQQPVISNSNYEYEVTTTPTLTTTKDENNIVDNKKTLNAVLEINEHPTPNFNLYNQDGTDYEPEIMIEEDENVGDDIKEQMKKVPNVLKNLIEKIGSDANVKNVLQKFSKKDDDGKPYIDLSGIFDEKTTKITEGKEIGNNKIVTGPKPNVRPAPQKPIVIPTVPPEEREKTVEGVKPQTNEKKKEAIKKSKPVTKKSEKNKQQIIDEQPVIKEEITMQEEIPIEKDNTFVEPLQEEIPVETEPINEEQPLDSLNGTTTPQKKKILLYKEKKN